MIVLTRKVPKKSKSYSHYGDRNIVILEMEDGVKIEIMLRAGKANEVAVAIDGPASMQVTRKELLTGFKGIEYEKRKAEEVRRINALK